MVLAYTSGKARGEKANGKAGIVNEAFNFPQTEAANRPNSTWESGSPFLAKVDLARWIMNDSGTAACDVFTFTLLAALYPV